MWLDGVPSQKSYLVESMFIWSNDPLNVTW
jgi:hypothetical protein